MNIAQYIFIGVAGLLAGGVNALAGGGTLISFPALMAMGLPAVSANITNTVALCPGYFGAALTQMKEIASQKRRVLLYVPEAILGGLAGGYLLAHTSDSNLRLLIPNLILLATVLLAAGEPIRNWLNKINAKGEIWRGWEIITLPAVALAAVYGGYFGAGLSVIYLAVLGLFLSDSLPRLNALKQMLALATNLAAAVFFMFSGKVNWGDALVMAVGALIGGAIAGRFAGKINPVILRWIVVAIGLLVSIYYFVK